MAKKRSRIYIELENTVYDFLWMDVKSDESVYIGLTEDGVQGISHIQTNAHIPALKSLYSRLVNGKHKISFHRSGRYKTEIPLINQGDEDRSTTYGPPLAEINEPRLMANIIYPISFLLATKNAKKNHITLPIAKSTNTHFACSVYCMAEKEYSKIQKTETVQVEGATWSSYNALIYDKRAWCFLLHDSIDARLKKNYVSISMQGHMPTTLISK